MSYRHILLASHGTAGARAAEFLALSLCDPGGTLLHLLVVPEFWSGMMGDDWLNNARTRIAYGNYVEGQISRELAAEQERIAALAAARGIGYHPEVRQGDPARCLIDQSRDLDCDLVIIGSPRPKGREGLRSRLDLETLVRGLGVPLLVAPFPHG